MKKEIILLFILSTSFFIFQHWYERGYLWDFYSYELNGRHWFFNGKYYEPFRPPLTPFLIGIFGANVFSEYVYIIFVSIVFLYSSIKIARALKIDEFIFYGISLNFFVLTQGLLNGTELLSLSFIELMIAYVINKKEDAGGIFYSLSSLTRYNFLTYFIFLFYNFNWKKILKGLIFAIAIFSPWLIYNRIVYGNYFLSVIDSYVMNYYYRNLSFNLIQIIEHFLIATNFLLPIFVFGLSKIRKNKRDVLFLLLLILPIIQYLTIPLKSPRYLFPIVLPLVYFSTKVRWKKEHVFLLFILSLILSVMITPHATLSSYKKVLSIIKDKNCSLESNVWIYFNYLGRDAYPAVNYFDKDSLIVINKNAEYNKSALRFKNNVSLGNFVVYYNRCKRIKMKYDLPYINLKARELNESKSLDPCDYVPVKMICEKINEVWIWK